MACNRPWTAWAPIDGSPLLFKESKDCREVKLPCGKCMGCRQIRQRNWAIRVMHEAQMHEASSFVTLTYADEHYTPSLEIRHWQDFMRRVRYRLGPTRFFMGGEYGDKLKRPHWHAILFGRDFPDRTPIGDNLYRSASLEELWQKGYVTVGDVTWESARYVAKYACKKISGDRADSHYSRVDLRSGEVVQVEPEFGTMSLRPAIGKTWLMKYWREVYAARDGVVLQGGRVLPPPRYYDKLLKEIDSNLSEYKELERYIKSEKFGDEQRQERLDVKEFLMNESYKRKRERL